MESENRPEKEAIDVTTEEKILAAAKKIFTQRGYDATKVRDIATEADINLSLVNYYFRSKEKLFEVIMMEHITRLFGQIIPVLNDESTSLEKKISFVASFYIDMLIETPDLAKFILNEVMSGFKIQEVAEKIQLIKSSYFAKQVFALKAAGKIGHHPLHILMNLMSMIFFPFVADNVLKNFGLSAADIRVLMEERRTLIPVWVKSMLED